MTARYVPPMYNFSTVTLAKIKHLEYQGFIVTSVLMRKEDQACIVTSLGKIEWVRANKYCGIQQPEFDERREFNNWLSEINQHIPLSESETAAALAAWEARGMLENKS